MLLPRLTPPSANGTKPVAVNFGSPCRLLFCGDVAFAWLAVAEAAAEKIEGLAAGAVGAGVDVVGGSH